MLTIVSKPFPEKKRGGKKKVTHGLLALELCLFLLQTLLLLLVHVGDEEAPVPTVLMISIWRLVKGRIEPNVYHHPSSLAVLA